MRRQVFPGFQILAHTLKGIPVTLIDLGLLPAQRAWCNERGIPLMTAELKMPAPVKGWQIWNKPFYLEASPYEDTLWMDCDTCAPGSVVPLLESIDAGPLILRHWDEAYDYPNDESLYDLFPTRTRFANKRLLNAGVLGIRKSRDLRADWFLTWRDMVLKSIGSAKLRSLISYYDEGALIWALEATASVELITNRQEWNRFVGLSRIGSVPELARALHEPTDDVVWHFSGNPKVFLIPPPQGGMLSDDALELNASAQRTAVHGPTSWLTSWYR